MSLKGSDFLDLKAFLRNDPLAFLKKSQSLNIKRNLPQNYHLIGLVFLEPSTRTHLSFETAIRRIGAQPLTLATNNSSVLKGETVKDTLLTIESLGVSAIVVRHGGDENLSDLAQEVKVPLINAGERATGHPTQAVLDAYTLYEEWGSFENKKVLFVGDVKHSRVAKSDFELFHSLGMQLAVCAPKFWLPETSIPYEKFSDLSAALQWCDACNLLRIQSERHKTDENFNKSDVIAQYGLTKERLQALKTESIILAPGPYHRGVELTDEVLQDTRVRIRNQVGNGVRVRMNLLMEILGVSNA